MNLLRLSFLLLLAVTYASCGDDDDPTCVQADWVGTYTGTITCDGDTEDVTVAITASGSDAVFIEYSTMTVDVSYTEPITLENCNLELTGSDMGITVSIAASLDGDNVSLTEIFSGSGFESNCTITATRD
jgi:hypothetical protein